MKKHNHGCNMLWDDDWCGCKVCGQEWKLDLKRGWMPLDEEGNEIARQFFAKPKPKSKSNLRFSK